MKQQPIDEQAAREALPTETKRNFGLPTAGVIALGRRNGNLLDFVRRV
jgi:hypothetical protein